MKQQLLLQEELSCTYLEALAETGENLFQGAILQEELSELTVKRLKKQYEEIHLEKYSNEEIRKAYQLVILKGMKENVQPNHQMTPDSVGMLVAYLVDKVYETAIISDSRPCSWYREFIDNCFKSST